MSLYIRDPKVNELKRAGEELTLEERVHAIQDRYAALGPKDPDFDEKAFMDEIWEI